MIYNNTFNNKSKVENISKEQLDFENKTNTKEEDFHKSRIIFAVIDNSVHWTDEPLSHDEWLSGEYNITEEEFENIPRGYIRKEQNTVKIICYEGKKFEKTLITNKQLKALFMIADIQFYYDTIEIYNGVEVGEVGEVWNGKYLINTINNSDIRNSYEYISLLEVLKYQKFITNMLNKKCNTTEKQLLEKELNEISDIIKQSITKLGKCIEGCGVQKRVYVYNNIKIAKYKGLILGINQI